MIKIQVKLKIFFGFFLASLGVGLFLFLAFRTSRSTMVESKATSEELAIMKDVEIIYNTIQTMESSYRGFFITADSTFLRAYLNNQKDLESSLTLLSIHGKHSEKQKSLSEALIRISKVKKAFGDSIIYYKSINDTTADFKLFRSGRGIALMDSVRILSKELESMGRSYFEKANNEKKESAQQTKNYFIVLSIVIFITFFIFYFIISSDLDRNNKAQQVINDANNRIRDLYDNAPCGYLTTNRELLITEINKTALDWLGMKFQDVSYKLSLKDICIEDPEPIIKGSEKKEISLKTKTGSEFHVQLDFIESKGDNGQYRIILIDISGKLAAEQKIGYFEDLINKSSDAIISTDINFIISSWNRGAEKLYGYSQQEALNKHLGEIVTPIYNTQEERDNALRDLLENDYWTGELAHINRQGEKIYILGSVSSIKDDTGKKIGYVALNQDITQRKLYEKELKQLNKELLDRVDEKTKEVTDTLERITDAVYSMDNNFTITFLNKKASLQMESQGRKVTGLNLFEAFPQIYQSHFREPFIRAKETQQVVEFEDQFPEINRWFYLRIYPSPNGISVFFQDVTEKHLSEQKIIETENKYQQLFENNPFPMWILDGETLAILDVNKSAAEEYGYSTEKFMSMNFLDLSGKDDEQRSAYRKKFTTPAFTGVVNHQCIDGRIIKMEVFFYELKIENSERKIVVANNITDLLNYQEELKSSRDQLRQLSSYLEKIREDERTNIAREIHDELGQQLTGLKMDVAWISRKIEDKALVHERIIAVMKMIDETVKTVRRIATDLRPGILDDFGLIAALEWQSREFEKRTGIRCIFANMQSDEQFDKSLATGIFRIYQEALTNVARHSQATEVNTYLKKIYNNYTLIIRDNGIGISYDPDKKKTLGLIGMKERALMLKGTLNVSGSHEKGTIVELIIPAS